MKGYITAVILLSSFSVSFSQNVGIGTTTPAARLHVKDSAVLFSGPTTLTGVATSNPPASGPGVRFMWYPDFGALRAGVVDNKQWDKDSIGLGSFAIGGNNTSTGPYSNTMGFGNEARGVTALAVGFFNKATNNQSAALGFYNVSSGSKSMSFGESNTAAGIAAFAAGRGSFASGDFSIALGNGANAKGWSSISLGNNTKAMSNYGLACGQFNDTSNTGRLFEIGNGTADNARSNVLTALLNGNVGIGTTNPSLGSGGTGLHLVNSTYTQLRVESSSGSGGIEFKSATGHLYEVQTDVNSNFFVYDRTAGSYRLFLNSSGNLGIGTTTGNAPLSFPATLTKKITLYPGGTGDVGLSVSGNDFRLYADNVNARVSFGYDDFTNGFISRAYVPASGTNALVVLGNMLVNGTAYSSDLRFKKNIHPLSDALSSISALQGVQYEMNREAFPDRNFAEGLQTGLIAQDVEKIIPEVVSTAADGYKSVDYAKLVPYLIESIKAQQEQLSKSAANEKQLVEKIDSLQQQLNQQQLQLLELKKVMKLLQKQEQSGK